MVTWRGEWDKTGGKHFMLAYGIFMGLLAGALLLWGIAIFRFDTPDDSSHTLDEE